MSRVRVKRKTDASIPGLCAGIVLIDQEPLRTEVAGECANLMSRLERARSGWHRFERTDKPAFIRWRAREFGALLSAAREVEVQIRDTQTLIHEVQMEMRRGFQDAYSAYQRVMFRRDNPSAIRDDEAETSRQPRGADRRLSDFEKEALFQEWVQKSLGTNPDKMDDAAYSKTFEAFKSHMFHGPRNEPPSRPNEHRIPKRLADPEEPAQEPTVRVDLRLKELYRILVRRLHPDLRADGSANVSGLWHEVQEAYAAGDVARMEILLALSDIAANRTAEQTLSQLRSVLMDLRRALRALEKSLLEAESEDAWQFGESGPSSDLRLRVERQLKSDLASRSERLDFLTRTIAEWAEGPMANRKVWAVRTANGFAS